MDKISLEINLKGISVSYPVVESSSDTFVVDPNLPLSGTTVPTLACMVPFVQSEGIV